MIFNNEFSTGISTWSGLSIAYSFPLSFPVLAQLVREYEEPEKVAQSGLVCPMELFVALRGDFLFTDFSHLLVLSRHHLQRSQ